MNFLNLMNKKTFRITAAQLIALESATKAVIGSVRAQATQLTNVDMVNGKASMVVGKARYDAVRLATNGRWYLTGDYTFA